MHVCMFQNFKIFKWSRVESFLEMIIERMGVEEINRLGPVMGRHMTMFPITATLSWGKISAHNLVVHT